MAQTAPIGESAGQHEMLRADAPRLALLSVYDKTGLLPFAKGLKELGFRLFGSGGTAKMIREAGMEIECVAARQEAGCTR